MSTDFLFAQPSYLSGLASMFDFAGALGEYNTAPTGEEADARALTMDWRAIADDYRAAFAAFEREHAEIARPS